MLSATFGEQSEQQRYLVTPEILQVVGPVGAVVHAILLAHNPGGGAQLTNKQIAKTANVSEKTARRALTKLRDAGLLKSEAVFQDNWQLPNRHQIPTFARHGHDDQTPGRNDHPNMYLYLEDKENQVDTDTKNQVLGKEDQEDELGGEAGASQTDPVQIQVVQPGTADTVAQVDSPGLTAADLGDALGARCARSQHAAPGGARSARTRDNIVNRPLRANEIAEAFHVCIEEATGRKVKNQTRIEGWRTSARVLLQDGHSVDEIIGVVEYVFRRGLMDPKHGDLKITNLKQVRDDYEHLLASTKLGKPASRKLPKVKTRKELEDLRRRLEEHR